jgi:hypothetical protein
MSHDPHRIQVKHVGNPWGLTQKEAEMIEAICLLQTHERAAALLGTSLNAAGQRVLSVRKKMGCYGTAMHLLWWDRWHREQ